MPRPPGAVVGQLSVVYFTSLGDEVGETYEVIRPEHPEGGYRMVEVAFDLVVLPISSVPFSLNSLLIYRQGCMYQEPQTAAAETIQAHQDVAVTDSLVPPPHMKM
jgi:hypothetical protein